MILVLLLFLPHSHSDEIVCYQIEVNTVYQWAKEWDDKRNKNVYRYQPRFSQVIAWRWSRRLDCKLVIDWSMADKANTGHGKAIINGRLYSSQYWIETHTAHDPEVQNRKILAPERRR